MLIDKRRIEAVAKQSSHPINREAARLLPKDWVNPGNLPVLGLARWGLEQNLVLPRARSKVTGLVESLDLADPGAVMESLDPALAVNLTATKTPEDGASVILDLLATMANANSLT